MHPVRKQRLIYVLMLVVFSSVAILLVSFAMKDNINLFFSPSEVTSGKAPLGQKVRVGGMVVEGSVSRADSGLVTRFALTDGSAISWVSYEGILPDLFAEGEAAVANGTLNADRELVATEVLAKHDEQYVPPEVADTYHKDGAEKPEGY